MVIDKVKNTKQGIIFGFLYKFILLFIPFIIRTIILKVLGEKYLGLNSLFTSIIQILNLTELGIGSAIVYNMYKPIAEDNIQETCDILGYYKKLYRWIGIIIIILGVVLTPFLKYFIKGDIPPNINLFIIYFIYLINTTISYLLYGYESSILLSQQRNDIENKIMIISYTVVYSFQIPILFFLKSYYLYIILLPISTLLINFIRHLYVRKKYPQFIPTDALSSERKKEIKSMFRSLIGHKIGGVAINSSDNIVISSFLGLSAVAIYNNYYYIFSAVSGFLMIIYSSMTAGIGNSVVVNSKDKNYKDFSVILFLDSFLVIMCCILFLNLYQPFMCIWLGEEYLLSFIIVVLLVLYFFFQHIRYILVTYVDACGLWGKETLKPYVEVIVNLTINIILINYIGLSGVILSTILTILFISIPWESVVLYKYYFNKPVINCLKKLFYYFIILLISGLISYFICSLINVNYYLSIVFYSLISIAVTSLIFVLFNFKQTIFKESIYFIKKIIWR